MSTSGIHCTKYHWSVYQLGKISGPGRAEDKKDVGKDAGENGGNKSEGKSRDKGDGKEKSE